jgi:tetratricopeptide (TPR) repeat protein
MGLFYDKQGKNRVAENYYNKSIKSISQDNYLISSNYRNIGEIYFREAKYKTAGKYYDSTLIRLDDRTREFRKIKKKRINLDDVIKYESIAQQNDSILSVVAMNDSDRNQYYEKHIAKLKIEDERKAKLAAEKAEKEANLLASQNASSNSMAIGGKDNATAVKANTGPSSLPPGMMGNLDNNSFYFYNPVTVEYGKKEFATKWGKRELKDNWKWSNLKSNNSNIDSKDDENMGEDVVDEKKDEETTNPLYTVDFYLKQIPTDKKLLDSLAKDRNFAYYQLGLIYKEKFRENELAASRLEQLLKNNPEERLILPAKYNLYKIYQIISPAKAELIKQQILAEYPTSRYAEIVKNPTIEIADETNPEAVFKTMYKKFENNQIREVSGEIDEIINRFTGEESVAKFELLKAKVIGRLQGLDEYKKALNFVALTYPNIEEGKQAESLLKTDIPKLEALDFSKNEPTEWKLVFPKKFPYDKDVKNLTDKIEKYLKDSNAVLLKSSDDIYSVSDNFIVIHGFSSKESANSVLSVLKEHKNYKIKDQAYIISTEDYKIVQMKKKFEEWLLLNK